MNTQELFEKIEMHYEMFRDNHSAQSKAAHQRARRALNEIKKLITEYKRTSVAEDKAK
jgi:hypothetical protein